MSKFTLSSRQISADASIPAEFEFNGFGCNGKNLSPQLSWENAPEGTKSFAVSVYDPDAPTGSGFWHWYVVNIPADVKELVPAAGSENSTTLPAGAFQLRNDYGYHGWGGACPPEGDKPHRYIFTVHALSVEKIDVDEKTPTALAGFLVHMNTLATASFTAYYQR
ncbi:phosphatidylethanolamine-binding protein [Mergibacter septicus]|uniref:YbhB/YbcL family Raf kinase inhibitor-like protein n=1 Tax=Mergibacter septicus TaxID=221402 RepID=UPI001178EBE8|nr:YbhB/YbcL family Raf kinase inhibitor-like protein [Mergibacter septicus]AWX13141.1 phosphatidylethanolamine-binding protein [Mergibacter septicus]